MEKIILFIMLVAITIITILALPVSETCNADYCIKDGETIESLGL
jgi:hypothetical protein